MNDCESVDISLNWAKRSNLLIEFVVNIFYVDSLFDVSLSKLSAILHLVWNSLPPIELLIFLINQHRETELYGDSQLLRTCHSSLDHVKNLTRVNNHIE